MSVEIIENHFIRFPLTIQLNGGGGGWTFHSSGDGTYLEPAFRFSDGKLEFDNVIVLSGPRETHINGDNRFRVDTGNNQLHLDGNIILRPSEEYRVDIWDSQGRRWRVFDQGNDLSTTTFTTDPKEVFTNFELEEEFEYEETRDYYKGPELVKIIRNFFWIPDNPYVWDIFPDTDRPSQSEFDAYTFSTEVHKLPSDSARESNWKASYDLGDIYWVNHTDWAFRWNNVFDVATFNNGDPLYQDITLFWTLTNTDEGGLTPDEIRRRCLLNPVGLKGFKDWMDNGGVYNDGGGNTEANGHFLIDLKDIYRPYGNPPGSTFIGEGKLWLAMGNTDGSAIHSNTISYVIKYDSVIKAGSLVHNDTINSDDGVISFRVEGYLDKEPISDFEYTVKVDSNPIKSIAGFTNEVVVNDLDGNTNYTIEITGLYMNKDSLDSSNTLNLPIKTRPKIAGVAFSIVPKLVDNTFLFDLQIDVDNSGNDLTNMKYAFFRVEGSQGRDEYLTASLDTASINTDLHSGTISDFLIASNSKTFANLTEADIEDKEWVIIMEDTSTSNRNFSVIIVTNEAILGSDTSSPDTSSRIQVLIPKEVSSRYAKEVRVNKIESGLILFGESVMESRSYRLNGKILESVSIEVEDFIPPQLSGDREEFIRYFINLGGVRHPITPKNKVGPFPQLYHINLPVDEELKRFARSLKEEFVDVLFNLSTFEVEVELSGDDAFKHLSPVFFGWRIITTTSALTPRSVLARGSKPVGEQGGLPS